ncbi:peptide chain release factor N(5)-glutamine methyltransferase [Pantanalinema rosaneae CENA516]|uniref:peptide chain release factor N(5)-glutamine methyltransferase n=1 Tax=Pantanalinema rosaneae TaxID=1620701 RepID=UPI003D6FE612
MNSVAGIDLWQWRSQAYQQAIAANISTAEVDWLLQSVSDLDRLSLRLDSFKHQAAIPLKLPFVDLVSLWQQRIQARVPVQYLIGRAAWRQFWLQVSPAVLIPRPETEGLIDLVVAARNRATLDQEATGAEHWADLGTGSGAIALGLADALPLATIHAVDRSQAALAIAQTNARNYGLSDRIHFYQGDWLAPLAHLKGQLRGLVSNPPYIPSQMVLELQPEVTRHEPHLALDGGIDGLDCIRHLVNVAPVYLQPGGIWLVEMMAGQADAVTQLLRSQGNYTGIEIHSDLAGIDRFALAYRR